MTNAVPGERGPAHVPMTPLTDGIQRTASRAAALIVSGALLPGIERIALADRRSLRHIIVAGGGDPAAPHLAFEACLSQGSTELEAELRSLA